MNEFEGPKNPRLEPVFQKLGGRYHLCNMGGVRKGGFGMRVFSKNFIAWSTGVSLAVWLSAGSVSAQRDEYGDVSAADVSNQTVARI